MLTIHLLINRPLVQYMQDLGVEGEVLQLGWRIVNDSLRTDACLLFPPYEIALGTNLLKVIVNVWLKTNDDKFFALNLDSYEFAVN